MAEVTGEDRATDELKQPELVFGLIGALGAEIGAVEGWVRDRVSRLGYVVPETIKLTALLRELRGPAFDALKDAVSGGSIAQKMDAGNALRALTRRGEAMAMLGVNRIRSYREEHSREGLGMRRQLSSSIR